MPKGYYTNKMSATLMYVAVMTQPNNHLSLTTR